MPESDIAAAGLIASRLIHYLALSVLFGGSAFPLYGAQSAGDAQRILRWLKPLLLTAGVLTLVSAVLWRAFATTESGFMGVWLLRLLLATALAVLLLPKQLTPRRNYAVLCGSLILLASISLTGHAWSDTSQSGFVHRIADAVHLLAAGIWVGALVVLAQLIVRGSQGDPQDHVRIIHHAASEFSGVGTVVVAALVLTGFINPGFFLAGFKTPYDQVLLAKLALFAAMLVLAAANRFWLTPRLLVEDGDTKIALRGLRVSVLIETALAVLVIATVAVLGVLDSPGSEK